MKARLLLIVGVLLALLGAGWPYLLPKKLLWNDARAVELTRAAEALHVTMHAHDKHHDHDHFGKTAKDDDPEVIAAAKKYRNAQGDLDSAKFWANSMPRYLWWTGLAFCCVGVAAYFSTRGRT